MTIDEVNVIEKIIKTIDEAKDVNDDMEYIRDLYTIDNMIKGNIDYDQIKVYQIKEKYEKELEWLLNLEKKLRSNQRSNNVFNPINDLYNTRHSLIRVGIKRILERKGKKLLEDDLINNDNSNLYNKFIEKLNEN